MGTNRRSQIPAPALVISGTATSSFDPKAIPSRRARWPCRPGWGNHRRCPSFPVICILLSPSGAAGVFICADGEEQKWMQKGRGREVIPMMHMMHSYDAYGRGIEARHKIHVCIYRHARKCQNEPHYFAQLIYKKRDKERQEKNTLKSDGQECRGEGTHNQKSEARHGDGTR